MRGKVINLQFQIGWSVQASSGNWCLRKTKEGGGVSHANIFEYYFQAKNTASTKA